MRNLRFNHTCEHRFVFAEGEEPQVVNGDAFPITDAVDVPDTELRAQVWRLQRGAEVSVHDREADKLTGLKDADGIAFATSDGDIAELPVLVAPDPTDPADRTPREEAERIARDAGHTPEGVIDDHDRHREFARRINIEPGGPAAAPATPGRAAPPPPRPATAPAAPGAAPGRSAAPSPPSGSQSAPTGPSGANAQSPAGPGTPPPPGVGPGARTAPGAGIQPASSGQSLRPAPGAPTGPNVGAPAIGRRTNVDIQGTMVEGPGGQQSGQAPPPPPPPGTNR